MASEAVHKDESRLAVPTRAALVNVQSTPKCASPVYPSVQQRKRGARRRPVPFRLDL